MSRKRYGSSRSLLYAAMAAVDPANVIQVILATPTKDGLRSAEKFFIRKFQPVFNIRDADCNVTSLARSLSAVLCDDVITFGNRLLRQARPRLTPFQWSSLIADVASTGDRALAAKLARHARFTCKKARNLRALPQIVVPCAVPTKVIAQVQVLFRKALLRIPGYERLPQFTIQLRVGRICWSKSPMADSIIALAFPRLPPLMACCCKRGHCSDPREHLCLRHWESITACRKLWNLIGDASLSFRTYPSLESVMSNIHGQAGSKLRSSGMPSDAADEISSSLLEAVHPIFTKYWNGLPKQMLLQNLKAALVPI